MTFRGAAGVATMRVRCGTGKKVAVSASRILTGSKRIPYVAGVPNPKVCATTGGVGKNQQLVPALSDSVTAKGPYPRVSHLTKTH